VSLKSSCRHRSSYNYTPPSAKLIEACYQIRVTRLKELARFLGLSISYTHYLIKRLHKDILFRILALPSHDRIGLRCLRCFLEARHAVSRQILLEVLSRHDFVVHVAQYHGSSAKGIYCEFLVPNNRVNDLTSFLESLLSHGVIDAYAVHPIALNNIVMGFEWYDFSTNTWHFKWQNLLKDVLLKVDALKTLHDHEPIHPVSNIKFDFYDLYILYRFTENVFTPLSSLASKLGTSPQNLSYHYRNHVLKNELIEATRPYWYPFLFEESSPYILSVEFEDAKALKGFVESLQRKPIAYSYTYYKRVANPSAMLSGFLPYDEIFELTKLLDLLKDYGLVKNYEYYIIDIYGSKGKSLPYHRYDEVLGWRFELEPYLEEILKAAKKAQGDRAKFSAGLVARFASAADSRIEPV